MAYFDDLSVYRYIPECFRPETLNVGWLAIGHDFEKRSATDAFLGGLWRYCAVSVAQTRGIHLCDFCQDSESFVAERGGARLLLGSAECRVFSRGRIYAAPTLIYHYVAEHQYRPPDEFIEAVLEAPSPSRDYFERLESLGLEWRWTSEPSGRPFRLGS
jgi:hypothetical protein